MVVGRIDTRRVICDTEYGFIDRVSEFRSIHIQHIESNQNIIGGIMLLYCHGTEAKFDTNFRFNALIAIGFDYGGCHSNRYVAFRNSFAYKYIHKE
jgi:hypothetical protein